MVYFLGRSNAVLMGFSRPPLLEILSINATTKRKKMRVNGSIVVCRRKGIMYVLMVRQVEG